ncbi:MAG: substrate-binding domain-containing protein [Rubrobacteraceae bacterium]|nr:substrate-binding domain-containing protein [Rubrobacteraceae bacterium]
MGAAGCGAAKVRQSSGGGNKGGSSGKKGPLRIAVVPKAVGFDYWTMVENGAKCAASKLNNVSIEWKGVTQETDVNGQVQLLQDFITQGVDALVYAATDAKVLHQVSVQALKKGIVTINIDSGTQPQPKEVPLIATNNVKAAEQATRYMAKQLGKKGGKVALIEFQPGTETNETRVRGFKNVMKQNPQLKLVAEQSSQSDYNTALRVTSDILTAHPDLNAIYAANEPSVLGAAAAVQKAGKAGKILIVGWDTAPGEIKDVRKGIVAGVLAQNPFLMGYLGVNEAVKKLRMGDKYKLHSIDTGAVLITQKNLKESKVQSLLHPSCKNPPTWTAKQ